MCAHVRALVRVCVHVCVCVDVPVTIEHCIFQSTAAHNNHLSKGGGLTQGVGLEGHKVASLPSSPAP